MNKIQTTTKKHKHTHSTHTCKESFLNFLHAHNQSFEFQTHDFALSAVQCWSRHANYAH